MKDSQIYLSEPEFVEFRNVRNYFLQRFASPSKTTTNDNKPRVILSAAKNLPSTCTQPVLSSTAPQPTTNDIKQHFSSPLQSHSDKKEINSWRGRAVATVRMRGVSYKNLSVCTCRKTTTNCNKFDAEPATAKDSG